MLNKCISPNNNEIAYRIIDDEVVLIDLEENTLNILNPVATFIWRHFDGETPLFEIVEKLSKEFEVDYETARKDCLEFVSELVNKNLVVFKSNLEEF